MNKPKKLLQIWIEAFAANDLATLVTLYHPDAVNYQVAAGEPAVGLERIKTDFEEFFRGFPDSYARVENLMADGDWAAWEWFGGGTFTGEFYGYQPTEKSYELRGCGFFKFRDERIILQRGYWDKLTWYRQVGIEIV